MSTDNIFLHEKKNQKISLKYPKIFVLFLSCQKNFLGTQKGVGIKQGKQAVRVKPFFLLNTTCPVLANCVDPDQLASEEAN